MGFVSTTPNLQSLLLAQSFDPFGNVIEQGGTRQSIFGYTGEQVDGTGLVYLRTRYYDPRVGRFLTADSIVPDPLRSVGWNRYAYVENNPIRYTDPSEHQCFVASVDSFGRFDLVTCLDAGGGPVGWGTKPDLPIAFTPQFHVEPFFAKLTFYLGSGIK